MNEVREQAADWGVCTFRDTLLRQVGPDSDGQGRDGWKQGRPPRALPRSQSRFLLTAISGNHIRLSLAHKASDPSSCNPHLSHADPVHHPLAL
jgi:hypothetical protein